MCLQDNRPFHKACSRLRCRLNGCSIVVEPFSQKLNLSQTQISVPEFRGGVFMTLRLASRAHHGVSENAEDTASMHQVADFEAAGDANPEYTDFLSSPSRHLLKCSSSCVKILCVIGEQSLITKSSTKFVFSLC